MKFRTIRVWQDSDLGGAIFSTTTSTAANGGSQVAYRQIEPHQAERMALRLWTVRRGKFRPLLGRVVGWAFEWEA